MPASKDPRAYPDLYRNIILAMDAKVSPITLAFEGSQATTHRQRFYGYVSAMRHRLKEIPRDKTIPDEDKPILADTYTHLVEVAMRYKATIEGNTLVFTNRNLDPSVADAQEQIDQLFEQHNVMQKLSARREGKTAQTETIAQSKYSPTNPEVFQQPESPVSHLFTGPGDLPELELTPEEVEAELAATSATKDQSDLSGLITPRNSPPAPQSVKHTVVESLKQLRKKEKQETKK